MNQRTTQKIINILELVEELEETKGTSQNISFYLLPTMIYNEVTNFYNDRTFTISSMLEIEKNVLENIKNENQSAIFKDIFNTILIHCFEKETSNKFQFDRLELEYFNCYFNSLLADDENIKKIYYNTSLELAKILKDEVFIKYIISK